MKRRLILPAAVLLLPWILCSAADAQAKRPVTPEDMFVIKDVGDVRISPDGARVVYSVISIGRAKNGYSSSLWMISIRGGVVGPWDI